MSDETTAAEARFLERPRPRGSELFWALGTFAELIRGFRATLIQTRKMRDFPLVLVGRDFWRPLTDFLPGPLEAMGA